MKELTNGILVFANDRILKYDLTASDGTHWGVCQVQGGSFPFKEFITPTRAQVEEKIKDMGYGKWYDGYTKKGTPYTIKEGYQWINEGTAQETIWVVSGEVKPKNFGTAPAQLAEAILVAQLLNATKD
jgi:hypothetical protein